MSAAVRGWAAVKEEEGTAGSRVAPRTQAKLNSGQGPKCGGTISAEERWNMIAQAAYRRAARREFTGGDSVEDWSAAEADIDAQLAKTNVTVIP